MTFKKGFTITELIIVVVIVGIISAFAIPSLSKVMERSRVKRGRHYLALVKAASHVYKAKNGTYPDMQCGTYWGVPSSPENIACLQEINQTLSINIPYDPDIFLNYNFHNDGNFPATFTADVARKSPCWVLRVTSEAPLSDTNPDWVGGYRWGPW